MSETLSGELPVSTDPRDRDALAGQPIEVVERDGVRYIILGTAHVSLASVEAVRAIIDRQSFDAIAVELCDSRFQAIKSPELLQQMDLFAVLRDGKAGLVAAQLLLASYQARLAEQLGVEPGAEMKAAITEAELRRLPLWLVDRDVGITVGRAYRSVGFWKRMGLMSGLLGSVLSNDAIEPEEIEQLKEGDMLDSAFREFARQSQPLYQALIAERDAFMAARLRQSAQQQPSVRSVLVVIGAGHMQGLAERLRAQEETPARLITELGQAPAKSPWPKWFGYALIAFILAGFVWAFSQGGEVGLDLLLVYVLTTGLLGALGCILAGGHPASVVAAFVSSPITPLHPALASGTVSAAVELWVRKPTVSDFNQLRTDLVTWRGWWRNRVSRILINFFLTSLGTGIGVWLTGVRLIRQMFGTNT